MAWSGNGLARKNRNFIDGMFNFFAACCNFVTDASSLLAVADA